jgi:hypothetical protein
VVAQHRPERVGMDRQMSAALGQRPVVRVLEAECAQAHPAVVEAAAVEMDSVVGGAGIVGALQLGA